VIFIDSGALVARFIQRDQHHMKAAAIWEDLVNGTERCCTSNIVLSETLTLLARRTAYDFAARQAKAIYSSHVLEIIRPTAKDEATAVLLFQKYAEHKVSFCDCISFALMQARNIETAFTFDKHFSLAGFRTCP